MTEKTYIVEGCWPFPLDMLRHDGSRAASENDQRIIDEYSQEYSPDTDSLRHPVRISLTGPWAPNTARWESFGWTVPSDTQHAMFKQMWAKKTGCVKFARPRSTS